MSKTTDRTRDPITAAELPDGEVYHARHLPYETVFVTPEGLVGVLGRPKISAAPDGSSRPLKYADGAATAHLCGEVRKETANR